LINLSTELQKSGEKLGGILNNTNTKNGVLPKGWATCSQHLPCDWPRGSKKHYDFRQLCR
jgi:hypothetical protein